MVHKNRLPTQITDHLLGTLLGPLTRYSVDDWQWLNLIDLNTYYNSFSGHALFTGIIGTLTLTVDAVCKILTVAVYKTFFPGTIEHCTTQPRFLPRPLAQIFPCLNVNKSFVIFTRFLLLVRNQTCQLQYDNTQNVILNLQGLLDAITALNNQPQTALMPVSSQPQKQSFWSNWKEDKGAWELQYINYCNTVLFLVE